MSIPLSRNLICALAASLLAALHAGAQTVPAGAGVLTGKDRISASGCGSDSGMAGAGVILAASGAWSVNVPDHVFTGTSQTQGGVVRLSLDTLSSQELVETLEEEASILCGGPVTISSLAVTQAQLKVNKRRTVAKLQLKVNGAGSGPSGSGNGRYQLKAAGNWQ